MRGAFALHLLLAVVERLANDLLHAASVSRWPDRRAAVDAGAADGLDDASDEESHNESTERSVVRVAAVETEIDRHYGHQLDALGDSDPELAADIAIFRAEELEHLHTAREHGAEDTIGYPLLTAAIRAGCRLAIGLSKRI